MSNVTDPEGRLLNTSQTFSNLNPKVAFEPAQQGVQRVRIDAEPGLGEGLEQLELASGQVDRTARHERLKLVGPDLELGRDHGAEVRARLAAAAAAYDGLDARHHLLWMAGLRDPVVGAET